MEAISSLNLRNKQSGICRYCKCIDALACDVGCSWLDEQQTVCDAPICAQKFAHDLAKKAHKLMRLGINIQKLNTLSCYSESNVIIETLLAINKRQQERIVELI